MYISVLSASNRLAFLWLELYPTLPPTSKILVNSWAEAQPQNHGHHGRFIPWRCARRGPSQHPRHRLPKGEVESDVLGNLGKPVEKTSIQPHHSLDQKRKKTAHVCQRCIIWYSIQYLLCAVLQNIGHFKSDQHQYSRCWPSPAGHLAGQPHVTGRPGPPPRWRTPRASPILARFCEAPPCPPTFPASK